MIKNKDIDSTEETIKILSQLFKNNEKLPEGNIKESIDKIINREEKIAKQNILKR